MGTIQHQPSGGSISIIFSALFCAGPLHKFCVSLFFKTNAVGNKSLLIRFSSFNSPTILLVRPGKVVNCKACFCTHSHLKASRLSVQQSQAFIGEIVLLQACRSCPGGGLCLRMPLWHGVAISASTLPDVRVISCAGNCPCCSLVSIQRDRSLSCLLVPQVVFTGTGET